MCSQLSAQQLGQTNVSCKVTAPNGVVAGSLERAEQAYGNRLLSVHGVRNDGTVEVTPGVAGFVTPDGALGMKFGWTRAVRGKLHVTGHRLDGDAPPLRADVRGRSGELGFQASYLIFPTPGCWEVLAQLGEIEESKLTFVTKVVKIDRQGADATAPLIETVRIHD
ncbi:MAG: hypothetical protein ACRDFA_07945 [bacterium]